jgi:hypothetical protein
MANTNFTVKNGLTVANAVSVNSTAFYVNTFALITISNTSMYSYAGNATFTSTVTFANTVSFSGAPSFTTNTAFTANVAFSGTNTHFSSGIRTLGNTGIGVANPQYTLDVAGTYSTAKANVATIGLTDGATINWDASLGQIASVTLGGNRTIANPTNLKVGTYILFVSQDGAGSRTVTWGNTFLWPAGVAPTLSTVANRVDIFSFICNGTSLFGSFLPDVR